MLARVRPKLRAWRMRNAAWFGHKKRGEMEGIREDSQPDIMLIDCNLNFR